VCSSVDARALDRSALSVVSSTPRPRGCDRCDDDDDEVETSPRRSSDVSRDVFRSDDIATATATERRATVG
jgi:hypothetical protein